MNLIPDSQSLVCSFCLLANTFLDVDKSQTLLPNLLLTSEDDGLFIVLLMAPASSSATEVPIQADPVHNHANHDKSSFKVLALWRCWTWVCWQAAFRKIGSRESLGIQIGEETGPKFWQFQRWQQILSTFRSRSLPLVELNSKVLAPPSHRSRQESIEICHQKLHDWVWTCHICADNPILARKFSEAGPSFLLRSFYFHEVTSHKSNLKLVPGTLSSLDCEADAPTLQPPAGKVETTPPPVAPPVAPPDLPSAPAAVPAPVTAPAEPKPDEPAEPDKPDKPETVPAVQSLQSEAGTAETLGWGQKPPFAELVSF